MSRCEHAERISHFCITDSCNWKEAGGCENCMKKYHSHIVKPLFVTEAQITELLESLVVHGDVKPKCRNYQQAIYNYFNAMKTQIGTAIDSLSRLILHRVGSPYLYSKGLVPLYRKLKARDYRKIHQKQLNPFISFVKKMEKTQFETQQKQLYSKQATIAFNVIEQVNQLFKKLSQSFNSYEVKFDYGAEQFDKIREVNESRRQLLGKKDLGNESSNKAESKNSAMTNTLDAVKNTTNGQVDQKSEEQQVRPRPRKISFDASFQPMAMKGGANKPLVKETRCIEINQEIKENSEQENKQSANNLFEILKGQGINFPDLIVHTILPEAKSEKNLYDERENVKKKTIPIPMALLPEQQQPASPLIRKRRAGRKQESNPSFSIGLKKVDESPYNEDETSSPPFKNQDQGEHHIEEHEANSLALLMGSLHLKSQSAIPLLKAAIRECKSNLSAVEYLSYLYIETGQAKECLGLCNEVLSNIKHSSEYDQLSLHLINNKAAAMNMLGRYSEAIVLLETILEKTEKDIFFKNLADAYFSIGIYDKANFYYEKAVKLNASYDEGYFNLAVCLWMQGNYHNCRVAIDRALKLNPQNQTYKELSTNLTSKINNRVN